MRFRIVRHVCICVLALLVLSACHHRARNTDPNARRGRGRDRTPVAAQDYITPAESLYTSYNIRYEKPETVWAANYAKGAILPAGTPVLRYRTGVGSRRMPYIAFDTGGDAPGSFTLYIEPNIHPGIDADEMVKRVFSSKNFAQLTEGMASMEIQNIKTASVVSGMSKRAVLVSRGYPPENRTPSRDSNVWFYPIDRFRNESIQFSDRGIVTDKGEETSRRR